MGRHGYHDDIDDVLQLGRWRGMVKSAIRGKRGQATIASLRDALDVLPEKRLVATVLEDEEGGVCSLGALAKAKSVPVADIDIEDSGHHEELAGAFNVAPCLIQELEYENDEGAYKETPEQRWERMRRWCDRKLAKNAA